MPGLLNFYSILLPTLDVSSCQTEKEQCTIPNVCIVREVDNMTMTPDSKLTRIRVGLELGLALGLQLGSAS